MTRFLTSALAVACVFSTFAAAQTGGGKDAECGPNKKCGKDLPCCSQYGECGVGAYCLGGCDPLFSNTLDSCMPAPVCKSGDYKLNSLDDIEPNTKYLGDASKATWVSSGDPKPYPKENPDSILLTMAKGTVGTLLASTNYVWYGNIKAKMKTSREQGVVTAFILLSDVKDEVDFEWIGTDLNTAQSNYYFQGIPDYTHSKNLTVADTFDEYHWYEIDWTPEKLTWKIDNKEMRSLERKSTWNESANRYDYPQTPARVQLSLWPAGLPDNAEGTIEWAGGVISWDAEDVKNAGYYYARIAEVNIECYDPPSKAEKKGSKAYIIDDNKGLEDSVITTNDDTVLGSFDASGQDPDKGKEESSTEVSSKTTSSSDSEETSSKPKSKPQVPGMSGQTGNGGVQGGKGGDDDSSSDSGDDSSDSGSGSGGGDSGSGDSGDSGDDGDSGDGMAGFSQGDNSGGDAESSNSGTGAASSVKGERVLQGSMLAVLFAIAGVIVL